MSEGIWIAVITGLAVPLSVFITWFINRRKHVAEIYNAISESSVNAMDYMQTAMDNMHAELILAQGKIDALQTELIALRNQNRLLIEENHVLHRKIDDLTTFISGIHDTDELNLSQDPS